MTRRREPTFDPRQLQEDPEDVQEESVQEMELSDDEGAEGTHSMGGEEQEYRVTSGAQKTRPRKPTKAELEQEVRELRERLASAPGSTARATAPARTAAGDRPESSRQAEGSAPKRQGREGAALPPARAKAGFWWDYQQYHAAVNTYAIQYRVRYTALEVNRKYLQW